MTFDSLASARQAAVALFQATNRPSLTPGWKFTDMVVPSAAFWKLGYEHADDDMAAFKLMLENFARLAERDAALTILASNFALLPSEQILYFWMARWADQGYPVVEVGHRLAASLMATSVRDTSSAVAPWKAFGVKVPNGLLTLADGSGKRHPVSKVMTQTLIADDGRHVWNYMIQTDSTLTLWRHGVEHGSLSQMEQEGGIHWGTDQPYALAVPATAHDDRVNALVVRLLIGICLTMSDPSAIEKLPPPRSTRGRGKGRVGSGDQPDVTRYRLCKPVTVDVRDAVRDYLGGARKGGVPTVRVLVRGHWKRQACGPHHSERKWIHVEPYWRGPDGAPVAVRGHKVGDDE